MSSRNLGMVVILVAAIGLSILYLMYGLLPAKNNDQWRSFAAQNPIEVADPANITEISSELLIFPRPNPSQQKRFLQWQASSKQLLTETVYELDLGAGAKSVPTTIEPNRSVDDVATRIELWIAGDNGHQIPAVLLLPRSAQKVPALLVLPGHVKDGESGIEQMTQPIASYHNSAALKLAEAGYATLTIELRGFGILGPPNFPNHEIVAHNALLAGHFYKKLVIKDVQHAFEYLLSREEINSSRVGIAGVSLGAELAVAYAGLDERVKAIAFHSYGGKVGKFVGIQTSDSDVPHYCHIVPGSNHIFRQEDVFLLLAPRPTLGTRGVENPFSNQAFFRTLESSWMAFSLPSQLKLLNLPGQAEFSGHAFFVDETIEFLNDNL